MAGMAGAPEKQKSAAGRTFSSEATNDDVRTLAVRETPYAFAVS
jgi:hypothetical protein